MTDSISRHDLQHIILELLRVTVLTTTTGETQEKHSRSITQALADQHNALSSHIDQQYQGLNDRLDVLGRALLRDNSPDEKLFNHNALPPGKEKSDPSHVETLRVLISHRIPCRNWCPCGCHGKRKARVTMPGAMESLLGKMFVGYTGLPVLNKPCDFRGCRDRQEPAATMEYWFPWWFVAANLKLHLKYLPNTGPQLQLSTTRRVPDTSQSIKFATQGNIDGLRFLFSQKMASPRDVSDSRGYSLIRVSLISAILGSGMLKLPLVGTLRRNASVRNCTILA